MLDAVDRLRSGEPLMASEEEDVEASEGPEEPPVPAGPGVPDPGVYVRCLRALARRPRCGALAPIAGSPGGIRRGRLAAFLNL